MSGGGYETVSEENYDWACKLINTYRERAQDAYAMAFFYRDNKNLRKSRMAQDEAATNYKIAMNYFSKLKPRDSYD